MLLCPVSSKKEKKEGRSVLPMEKVFLIVQARGMSVPNGILFVSIRLDLRGD